MLGAGPTAEERDETWEFEVEETGASGHVEVFAGELRTGKGTWCDPEQLVRLPPDVPGPDEVAEAGPARVAAALGRIDESAYVGIDGARVLVLAQAAYLVSIGVIRISRARVWTWEVSRDSAERVHVLRRTDGVNFRDLVPPKGMVITWGSTSPQPGFAAYVAEALVGESPVEAAGVRGDPYRAGVANLREVLVAYSRAGDELLARANDPPGSAEADAGAVAARLAGIVAAEPGLAAQAFFCAQHFESFMTKAMARRSRAGRR